MVRLEHPARLCGYPQGHAILTVDPPSARRQSAHPRVGVVCPQRCVGIQLLVWIQEDREMDHESIPVHAEVVEQDCSALVSMHQSTDCEHARQRAIQGCFQVRVDRRLRRSDRSGSGGGDSKKGTLRTLPVCPCARRGQSCTQTASRQFATSGDGPPTCTETHGSGGPASAVTSRWTGS